MAKTVLVSETLAIDQICFLFYTLHTTTNGDMPVFLFWLVGKEIKINSERISQKVSTSHFRCYI